MHYPEKDLKDSLKNKGDTFAISNIGDYFSLCPKKVAIFNRFKQIPLKFNFSQTPVI